MAAELGPISESRGLSWRPPDPPAVSQVDVTLTAEPIETRCSAMLACAAEVPLLKLRWTLAVPQAVSVGIRTQPVRVRSFAFVESEQPTVEFGPAWRPPRRVDSGAAARATRIKPPGDVVKLEDRLGYLLQPPLEVLLAERSLEFPCRPFAYQMEGIAFLFPRQAAILADEMGLGKTMQAITAIRLLIRSGELRSVLLVCPKPLVSNWCREFALWAPEIPVAVVDGDQTRRQWQWRVSEMPVRIANYEILSRDHELLAGGDNGSGPVRFDLVVLDEAQRIKNRASLINQALCSVCRNRSWALTGTPVENSSEDLVGIFEFLAPGLLSSEMKPRRMGRTVSDHVLRRTKDQVLLDLPPKLFRDAEVELSPQQLDTYRLAEEEGVLRLTDMAEGVTIRHVFELVLRLKQICNFDPATGASSKLDRLEADLEEVAASGRKAIVFSQWVRTLEELARRLGRFGTLEYHGRVPSRSRDAVIRRFRESDDARVMLISYGAGGVGLNLQFASYVFLFDRWWNPAVEDQAINRAHRIGAAHPVVVSRFLTLGTIEERIDRILEEKRELFDTIFSGTEGPRKLGLTQEELFGLFRLKSPDGPIKFAA